MIDVGAIARSRIDVGIGAQPFVDAPAQELVDGLTRLLADDVPAGHLERAQDSPSVSDPRAG